MKKIILFIGIMMILIFTIGCENETYIFDGSGGLYKIYEECNVTKVDNSFREHYNSTEGKEYADCIERGEDLCFTNLTIDC